MALSTGAATLEIPLEVPRGTAGFEPTVALRYSSHLGDGPFGVGWHLRFGEIRRSTRFGVPAYNDASDDFELDGELLVEDPQSAWRFHPLTEDFSRIVYNPTGQTWTVTFTNGFVARFGASEGSRVRRDGATSPVARWLLDQLQDVNGNVVQFTYDRSDPGTAYPSEIAYSYRSGTPVGTLRRVSFLYEIRPDPGIAFEARVKTVLSKRVKEIYTTVGGLPHRRLVFAYATGYSTDRSRIESAQLFGTDCPSTETAPATNCVGQPKRRFTYADPDDSLSASAESQWPNGTWGFAGVDFAEGSEYSTGRDLGVRFADVDGDGRVDALRAYEAVSGPTHDVYLNTGSGWSRSSSWSSKLAAIQYTTYFYAYSVSPNSGGSGTVVPTARATKLYFSQERDWWEGIFADWNGDGLGEQVLLPPPAAQVTDVNGDGRADLIVSFQVGPGGYNSTTTPAQKVSHVYVNNGTDWVRDNALSNSFQPVFLSFHWSAKDVFPPQSPICPRSLRETFMLRTCSVQGSGIIHLIRRGVALADLNGDGRTDVVSSDQGTYPLIFSAGATVPFVDGAWLSKSGGWVAAAGFAAPEPLMDKASGVPADTGARLVDVNGDGLADFVKTSVNTAHIGDASGAFDASGVWLSTGAGWCGVGCAPAGRFAPPVAFAREYDSGVEEPIFTAGRWFVTSNQLQFADLNGDGLTDLVRLDGTAGSAGTKAWIQDPGALETQSTVWVADSRFDPPAAMEANVEVDEGQGAFVLGRGVRVVDADGNGAADLLRSYAGARTIRRAKSTLPDLVSEMTTGQGGVVAFEYETDVAQRDNSLETAAASDAAAVAEDDGMKRGFGAPVVTKVSWASLDAGPFTRTYAYARSSWSPTSRAALGFRLVETTGPGSQGTRAYFYQQEGRAGRPSLRQTFESGNLRAESLATWEVVDDGSVEGSIDGVHVGRLVQQEDSLVYGSLTGSTRTVTYDYDDGYGFNFVDLVTLVRPTGTLVIDRDPKPANSTTWISGLVEHETQRNATSSVVLRQTDYGYDARGLLTGEIRDIRPRTPGASSTGVSSRGWAYDPYGNLISRTDPKQRVEYFCYDGDTGLGPDSCPAPLNGDHSSLRAYRDPLEGVTVVEADPGTGDIRRIARSWADDEAFVAVDAFDRLHLSFIQASSSTEALLVEARAYFDGSDDNTARPYIERFEREEAAPLFSSTPSIRSARYFDGFGSVAREVMPSRSGWFGRATLRDFAGRPVRVTYDQSCGGDTACSGLTGLESPATVINYDALGRVLSETNAEGTSVAAYRRGTRSQPAVGGTGNSFDVILSKDRNGNLTQAWIDRERVVWAEECSNTVSSGTTDLTSVTCASPDTTFYAYESTGENSAIFDPVATATASYSDPKRRLVYEYDTLSRVVRVTDPDGGTTQTAYEASGTVASITNARLQTTIYNYDALDRLIFVDRPPGEKNVTIAYDPVSRMRASETETGGYSASFEYDALGRQSRHVRTVLGVTLVADFEYDLLGRLRKLRYPSQGEQIIYDYEGAYLDQVCEAGSWFNESCSQGYFERWASSAAYDAIGRETAVNTPAGWFQKIYNGNHQLWYLRFNSMSGGASVDLKYSYDPNGNVRRVDDTHAGVATDGLDATGDYTYDHRNRLSSHNVGGAWRYFRYDSLGNLIGRDLNSPSDQDQFFAGTKPHAISSRATGETYSYDADGNTARRGTQHLTYDSANRLVCVGTSAGTCGSAAFGYDVDGGRIYETDSGGSRILFDDFFEWSTSNNRATSYVHAFGRRIGVRVKTPAVLRVAWAPTGWPLPISPDALAPLGGIVALLFLGWLSWSSGTLAQVGSRPVAACVLALTMASVATTPAAGGTPGGSTLVRRWLVSDHLGTPLIATTASGAVVERRVYEPFGKLIASGGTESSGRFFTGKPFEASAGLYDFRARWYDPDTGRFLSVDPIVQDASDPQTLNPYGYVRNNPMNAIDPDGLGIFDLLKKLVIAILVAVLVVVAIVVLGPVLGPILGISAEGLGTAAFYGGLAAGSTTFNLLPEGGSGGSGSSSLNDLGNPQQALLLSASFADSPTRYRSSGETREASPGLLRTAAVVASLALKSLWRVGKRLWDDVARKGDDVARSGADDAARAGARTLDDLGSLRGASPKQLEDLIPKDFVKSKVRKGDGVRYADPARRGDQIRIMRGDPSAADPLHQGPYAVISRSGRVTRIPLEGNPTLP